MMRILLFLATNLAVMVLLTIVVKITGIDVWAARRGGLNLEGLLIMSAVFGMGGSFISLAMSKWIAKWSVGAQVIDQPRNATETWLFETVRRHAEKAPDHSPHHAAISWRGRKRTFTTESAEISFIGSTMARRAALTP